MRGEFVPVAMDNKFSYNEISRGMINMVIGSSDSQFKGTRYPLVDV